MHFPYIFHTFSIITLHGDQIGYFLCLFHKKNEGKWSRIDDKMEDIK